MPKSGALGSPSELELAEHLRNWRMESGLGHKPCKLLIVIDQFEQWLHANRDPIDSPLVSALRHCDGRHVQCVLLVRDDFWMPLTRVMNALEIPLIERENSMAMDLFDVMHARKVLTKIGQAYGRLPTHCEDFTTQHKKVIEAAISAIEEQGRIIPVRLGLIAEMLKAQNWEPDTLERVDWASSLGAQFLDQTFALKTSLPAYRLLQQEARNVLQALLPESGVELSLYNKSKTRLLEASGCRTPDQFSELIRVLDNDLRLITPVDQEAFPEPGDDDRRPIAEPRYQLTHDFLVPSIREWLWNKKRCTSAGRAMICLEERTALYRSRPESQQLPGLLEWLRIRLLTRRRSWTATQQKLMRHAGRRCMMAALCWAIALCALVAAGYELTQRVRGAAIVDSLHRSSPGEALAIMEEMSANSAYVTGPLSKKISEIKNQTPHDWKLQLASLKLGSTDAISPLVRQIRGVSTEELAVLNRGIKIFVNEQICHRIVHALWTAIHVEGVADEERLRLACSLAALDPTSQKWETEAGHIVEILSTQPLWTVVKWLKQLQPVKWAMAGPLEDIFVGQRSESVRAVAFAALAKFKKDEPEQLVELAKVAKPHELAMLVDQMKGSEQAIRLLQEELSRRPTSISNSEFNSLPEKPSAVIEQIESAKGIVAPSFAFCSSIPISKLRNTISEMKKMGYRPVRCRPFVDRGEIAIPAVFAAVIWTRDRLGWSIEIGVDQDQVLAKENELPGRQIVDLAAWNDQGHWKFIGIWVDADRHGQEETKLQLLTPEEQWWTNYRSLRKDDFHPQTVQVSTDATGKRFRTQIWRKTSQHLFREQRMVLEQSSYNAKTALPGRVPGDISLYDHEFKGSVIAAVWYRDLQFRTRSLQFTSLNEHLEAARQAINEGFSPSCISVAQPTPKQTSVVSVWRQMLPTRQIQRQRAASRANLALALVRLECQEPVMQFLNEDDNLGRHYFVHRAKLAKIEVVTLANMLNDSNLSAKARQSLLLAMGNFSFDDFNNDFRIKLTKQIQLLHSNQSNPAVQAATSWLLSKWQQNVSYETIDRRNFDNKPGKHPGSYISSEGQLMRVIPIIRPSTNFRLPEPTTRWIAVSAKEITAEEFARFKPDYETANQPKHGSNRFDSIPASHISADDAVGYCQWMNSRAGIPDEEACFSKIAAVEKTNDSDPFSQNALSRYRIRQDYNLRQGFRLLDSEELAMLALPEAEFAGAVGGDRHLLANYVRYAANSDGRFQRCGSLMPNQFGLFDLYGNAAEWILVSSKPKNSPDSIQSAQSSASNQNLLLAPNETRSVRLAGGCITSTTWQLGNEHAMEQFTPLKFAGFRIVRTLEAAHSDVYEEARRLCRKGDWKQALARFDQLSIQQPDNPFPLLFHSAISTWIGNMKSRQQRCKQILDRHWNTDDHIAAHELATELLAYPDELDDWSRIKRLSATARDAGIYPYIRSWAYLHVRMGQHAKAKQLLEELRGLDYGRMLVSTLCFQAMNNHHLGNDKEAKRRLQEAESLYEEIAILKNNSDYDKTWRGWLHASTLLREARSIVSAE